MKTIEERARERMCADCIFPQFQGKDACLECSACDNYIKIAEEQKAIDIDKACEWLRENLGTGNGVNFIMDFRKAMEE